KFIQQLADLFEVSTDYLLGRTDIRDINAINDRKFWEIYDKLKTRNDLLVLFEYTKDLSPKTIAQIMRIIKAIENTQNDEV
ncbi:MAG: XRE family transcriptional regulator, partial [Caldicoprobacter sp.]